MPGLFFFCGTGVWTQGFALARQALYHLNHTVSPGFLSIITLNLAQYLENNKQWTLDQKIAELEEAEVKSRFAIKFPGVLGIAALFTEETECQLTPLVSSMDWPVKWGLLKHLLAEPQWLMPITLTTWEAKMGRITIPGQPAGES
jgi:hypothetical protein